MPLCLDETYYKHKRRTIIPEAAPNTQPLPQKPDVVCIYGARRLGLSLSKSSETLNKRETSHMPKPQCYWSVLLTTIEVSTMTEYQLWKLTSFLAASKSLLTCIGQQLLWNPSGADSHCQIGRAVAHLRSQALCMVPACGIGHGVLREVGSSRGLQATSSLETTGSYRPLQLWLIIRCSENCINGNLCISYHGQILFAVWLRITSEAVLEFRKSGQLKVANC